MKDTRTNLSSHFTIAEAGYSQYAVEHGIDNTLPSIYYTNAINLAVFILEPIRLWIGKPFSPVSWYRGEAVNKGVGGLEKSQHMVAQAADIKIPNVTDMALAVFIRDNLIYDQLILENSWVHASYNKDNNRMEVLHKTPQGYAKGLM